MGPTRSMFVAVSVSLLALLWALPRADAAEAPAGAPVVVAGRTLFLVPEVPGAPPAAERARGLAGRVRWLASQPRAQIRALRVVADGDAATIEGPSGAIASVNGADARALGTNPVVLAGAERNAIERSALALHERARRSAFAMSLLYTVIATAVLLAVLRVLGYAFGVWLEPRLQSWHGRYIRSIRIQRFELVPAERITALLSAAARVLRVTLSVAALYTYVAVVMICFPQTRPYAGRIVGYVLAPLRAIGEALVAFLPNLFHLAVIGFVAYYFSRLVRLVFVQIRRGAITVPGFFPEWALPTYKILRFLIVIFTLIAAFPYIPGSKSPAFQGISIFLGLLFSLGSSSAIANVVAGIVLTYTRAFRVGDRVTVGTTTGDVIESTLLVTRVRTIKNVEIAIPNAMVLGSHIVNFSAATQREGLIVHTCVTIGYDVPWRTVHQLLIEAAGATGEVLAEPAPFVLQTALSDFYVSYEINAYTRRSQAMAGILSELHQHIQDRFYAAGVEIMSPHMFGVRDANRAAIPAGQGPPAPEPAGFHIVGLPARTPAGSEGSGP